MGNITKGFQSGYHNRGFQGGYHKRIPWGYHNREFHGEYLKRLPWWISQKVSKVGITIEASKGISQ